MTANDYLSMARSERAFAAEDRARRYGSAESARIHEQNAAEYEARAEAFKTAAAPVRAALP